MLHENVTGGSWKIHRTEFSRVSILQFRRMAHRWNLWSESLGSGGTAIFTDTSCPGPAHGKFLPFVSRTRQGYFEIADGYVQTNSASWRQWRKWIGDAELVWAKVYGGILYIRVYSLDCQDTYTENPKRLRYQNFRVNGTAWTSPAPSVWSHCGPIRWWIVRPGVNR